MNVRKHLNLFRMASANLGRFKAKSLAVVLPLALIMGISSFMLFIRGGFLKEAETARSFMPDITVQWIQAGRTGPVPLHLVDNIKNMPHVKKVIPRIWGYLPVKNNNSEEAFTMMGLDLENMEYASKFPLAFESGSFLVKGDRKKAVLGKGVALKYGAKTGDTLHFTDSHGTSTAFEIVGIFSSSVQIYSTDLIMVSMEDAGGFFGYGKNEVSDLLVYMDGPGNADNTALLISRTFKNIRVLTANALTDLLKEAFGRRSGTFLSMWLVLLVSVLFMVWAQISHISVSSGREIGILKAVGWKTGDIIEMKMMESAVMGMTGTITGILLGFVYALMGTPGISGYCLGCASIYPKFPVPVHCDIQTLLILLVLGIAPVTFVSSIPSWLAGIIEPDMAIRS